jgi:hypothetical protein
LLPVNFVLFSQAKFGLQVLDKVRVDNTLTYDKGEKISLKPGAEIDVVLEADSDATFKKHDVTEVTDKKFGSGG